MTPCDQREQGIGRPQPALLSLIPGLVVARIGAEMDCCGMRGASLGHQEGFHEKSIALSRPLMEKIQAAAPRRSSPIA
jgi:hypothetical protein